VIIRSDKFKFMICGVPRSGTTLLAAIFNSCEGCTCLSEPHLELLFKNSVTALGHSVIVRDRTDTPLDQLVSSLNGHVGFKETFRSLQVDDDGNVVDATFDIVDLLKNQTPFPFSGISDSDLEMFPITVRLFENYEQAGYRRFNIVRDPVACWNSTKVLLHKWGRLNQHMLTNFATNYTAFIKTCDEHSVIYENLCLDPSTEIFRATKLIIDGPVQLVPDSLVKGDPIARSSTEAKLHGNYNVASLNELHSLAECMERYMDIRSKANG